VTLFYAPHKYSYLLTYLLTYKMRVQRNTESVQCLAKKYAYHNKVRVTREQLS